MSKIKRTLVVAAMLIGTTVIGLAATAYHFGMILNPSPSDPPKEKHLHEFTMTNIDGKGVNLAEYSGKVTLLVNTASKCGLTPQYEGLQKIYDRYKDQGFVVLGFPANNFMGQEPGTESDIKEFCTLNYKVTFPMFAKLSVKGADQHPLYTFLTHKESNPGFDGEIGWNFAKFLADRNGKIIGRFSPRTDPDDPEITTAIESALSKNGN